MITAEIFRECTGRDPAHDDLDRCNCTSVGTVGHLSCGWCGDCSMPRSECGHLVNPDLPEPGAETYLGDGLYISFDGMAIRLRAPRLDGDHWVALEQPTYRELLRWVASYPVLWEHFATNDGRRG